MKPHLYFNNPQEGLVEYQQRPGGGRSNDSDDDVNYIPIANAFELSKNNFLANQVVRHEKRTLEIPNHFDLIEIEFQAFFDQPQFEQAYYNSFGLSLVHLSRFNKVGLFIISDIVRLNSLFNQLDIFIRNIRNNQSQDYDANIKFIRSFKLYDSGEMIRDIDNYNVLHFSLIHHQLLQTEIINPQQEALNNYLNGNGIDYNYGEHYIEVFNTSEEVLNKILDNFDIVYATCSGSGSIVRPDAFNLPEREFGFTISNENIEELPIIGIIDSGVSNNTPITPLIINPGEEYDLTNTGLFFDHTDHGTGVAAFAAFGNRLIPNYRGAVKSDARVLPIKILNSQLAPISQSKILELIKRAHTDYGVKIFTLTVGYGQFPILFVNIHRLQKL